MLTRRLRYSAKSGTLTGTRQSSACVSCQQAAGCASALLTRFHDTHAELSCMGADTDAHDGDEYLVGIRESDLLRVCAVIFPGLSAALLSGAWMAGQLFATGGDAAMLLGGLGGLAVGALLLRLYDARFGSRGLGTRLVIAPSGRVSHSDP